MKKIIPFIAFIFLSQVSVAENANSDSALCGNLSAQDVADIGWMFWQKKKFDKSFQWDLSAAKQGYIYGQKRTGLHYQRGLGVDKDYKKAAYWHKKAAMQGDFYSVYNLATIYYEGGYNLESDRMEAYMWALLGDTNIPLKEEEKASIKNKQLIAALEAEIPAEDKEKAKREMELLKDKQRKSQK